MSSENTMAGSWMDILEWQQRDYRPDWRPLVALGFRPPGWPQRSGKLSQEHVLRIPWSTPYWALVDALLAAHGGLSLGQFCTFLPAAMSAHMLPTPFVR